MPLRISDLHVAVGGNEVVAGVNLTVEPGTIQAIMGPNGSGKSTLAHAIIGHPAYTITGGSIFADDSDITHATPEDRAKAGVFLSFQHPVEIPGVSVKNLIRASCLALHGSDALGDFDKRFMSSLTRLGLDDSFASRSINEGFSGGEKKRMEMVQLLTLKPKYAILDETDSGLDVDAIQLVAKGIEVASKNGTGVLIITHYSRILSYLKLDKVHILESGKISKSGDAKLAMKIESTGYSKK